MRDAGASSRLQEGAHAQEEERPWRVKTWRASKNSTTYGM